MIPGYHLVDEASTSNGGFPHDHSNAVIVFRHWLCWLSGDHSGGSIRFNLGLWSWWLNYHLYDGLLSDGLPEDEVCCSSLLLVISVILFCNTKYYQ
jgi:hypothetical protein